MSVQSEITRLQNAKTALKTAIESKGVTVPSNTKLDGYADLVESISGGGDDDRWYFVVGDYSSTSTEDRYVTKIYLLFWNNGGRWMANASKIRAGAYNYNCWFEYKGEKYFVDSFSDGNHTLSKTGSPVKCIISDFMELYITESDGVYKVFYMED